MYRHVGGCALLLPKLPSCRWLEKYGSCLVVLIDDFRHVGGFEVGQHIATQIVNVFRRAGGFEGFAVGGVVLHAVFRRAGGFEAQPLPAQPSAKVFRRAGGLEERGRHRGLVFGMFRRVSGKTLQFNLFVKYNFTKPILIS